MASSNKTQAHAQMEDAKSVKELGNWIRMGYFEAVAKGDEPFTKTAGHPATMGILHSHLNKSVKLCTMRSPRLPCFAGAMRNGLRARH
jgi:hypothetical protein